MADGEEGVVMGAQIRPLWDPTGSVSVEVDGRLRRVVVRAAGELVEFALAEERPGRLGWVELRDRGGGVRRRRVAVGEVVCHCLREWEAEQEVLELSRAAARRALARGGPWAGPGRRLGDQARAARSRQRVSTLPFQVLFAERSDPARGAPLSASVAAQRVGYRGPAGRSDTHRLMRRLGLACHGGGCRQRSVRYETGVALCRAVGVDPVDLGL